MPYKGALDAVEEENLKNHEDRGNRVQSKDVVHCEPSFSKDIANFEPVSGGISRVLTDVHGVFGAPRAVSAYNNCCWTLMCPCV